MTGKSRPSSSPRLYCLMAREAPVALVFRRGPGAWSHLLRWHYDEGVLEPGVWLRKRLFPEKCDLSDDGELMLYNLSGAWKGEYTVYGGISRAPWLHPLVDWDLRSTYSCGRAFVKGEPDSHSWGEPESIELGGRDVIVQTNGGGSSVNELRRGWELRDQPKTEERVRVYAAVLRKPSPAGGFTLQQRVSYRYAREIQIQRGSGEFVAIEDAAWADWDRRGRLLIASRSGELRIEEVDAGGARLVVQRHDLSTLKPTVPAPAPEWARSATAAREKIDETRLKLMARISCLLAIGAPVALVFWRGAGGWGHLMRWRYLEGVVEPGAWSRMVLWASVCDLSMDGELLLFPTRPGSARRLFASISRAPWLHPLVTWQA